jgi:adenosylhomocysteine nucleosidase
LSKLKLLIITPTQKEFDLLLQGCASLGLEAQNSEVGRVRVVRFPDLGITLACGGAGKAQFAAQTQHLLDASTDWDVAVCAGAAGGLVDELGIGDVVVATTTVEHDYHNRFSKRPLPKFDGAPTVIADLRRVELTGSFRVVFGIVASGDEDIVDGGRRRALQQSTEALVVAWEGAGGARACAFSNIPFVEIRGVTDTANHDAPSDHQANLELVMHNVAKLVVTWLVQSTATSRLRNRVTG